VNTGFTAGRKIRLPVNGETWARSSQEVQQKNMNKPFSISSTISFLIPLFIFQPIHLINH